MRDRGVPWDILVNSSGHAQLFYLQSRKCVQVSPVIDAANGNVNRQARLDQSPSYPEPHRRSTLMSILFSLVLLEIPAAGHPPDLFINPHPRPQVQEQTRPIAPSITVPRRTNEPRPSEGTRGNTVASSRVAPGEATDPSNPISQVTGQRREETEQVRA